MRTRLSRARKQAKCRESVVFPTPPLKFIMDTVFIERTPLSGRQPRNRALTDIIAPRNAALRLTRVEALAGLFLLVRGEDRLAAEFDAIRLGIGPAARGALQN